MARAQSISCFLNRINEPTWVSGVWEITSICAYTENQWKDQMRRKTQGLSFPINVLDDTYVQLQSKTWRKCVPFVYLTDSLEWVHLKNVCKDVDHVSQERDLSNGSFIKVSSLKPYSCFPLTPLKHYESWELYGTVLWCTGATTTVLLLITS